MTDRVCGIRGATQVDADEAELIASATKELVAELLAANALCEDDLISVVFTSTPDLRAAYPATAARASGLSAVALLGAQEADIEGGLPRVIRVLMHAYCARPPRHVFLRGASVLRTDLAPPGDR